MTTRYILSPFVRICWVDAWTADPVREITKIPTFSEILNVNRLSPLYTCSCVKIYGLYVCMTMEDWHTDGTAPTSTT